jgi:hypothetical protein
MANIWEMQDGDSKRSVFTHCRLSVHGNGGRAFIGKENDLLVTTMPLSQLNLDIK